MYQLKIKQLRLLPMLYSHTGYVLMERLITYSVTKDLTLMVTLLEKYIKFWVSKCVLCHTIRKETGLQNVAFVMLKKFYDLSYYHVNCYCINGDLFFQSSHLL